MGERSTNENDQKTKTKKSSTLRRCGRQNPLGVQIGEVERPQVPRVQKADPDGLEWTPGEFCMCDAMRCDWMGKCRLELLSPKPAAVGPI